MAVTLNQIDQISDGQVIKAGHISQSLVAFSGRAAYNINLSGSFAVTGSMYHSEVSDAAGVASSVLVRDNTTGEYYTTGSYGGSSDSSPSDSSPSGYEFTGGFAAKTDLDGFVWDSTSGVQYTSANADAGDYLKFGLDRTVHLAVDRPYWTDPTPNPNIADFGMFAGDHLPADKTTSLINYTTAWEDGTIGSIALDGINVGDLVSVRFDYNILPQVQNTTVETGLQWATRDASNNVTFEFFLQGSTTFFGQGSVGVSRLQRVTSTAYLASAEDINAIALPVIKSDNPVIIQPLSMLVTITK